MARELICYDPEAELQDEAFVTVVTCADESSVMGNGGFVSEHIQASIDREKLETFLHCCDWIGANPALEVQQALDLLMDSVIALALATKEAP